MTEWRRRKSRGIVMFPDWRYRSEEEEEENGHVLHFSLDSFVCLLGVNGERRIEKGGKSVFGSSLRFG